MERGGRRAGVGECVLGEAAERRGGIRDGGTRHREGMQSLLVIRATSSCRQASGLPGR